METERPTGLNAFVRKRIHDSINVQQQLARIDADCAEVAWELVRAFQGGRKLILFGNGGSAGEAQHIAAEFVGRFYRDRRALPACALTVDTSALTAIGNDYAFDQVFSRQLEALGQPGDVAVGMSTSGRSANVVEALRTARRRGLIAVALTGEDGGLAQAESDYCVRVPSRDTPRIQEAHLLIGHIWSELVERVLFGAPDVAERDEVAQLLTTAG